VIQSNVLRITAPMEPVLTSKHTDAVPNQTQIPQTSIEYENKKQNASVISERTVSDFLIQNSSSTDSK